MSCRYANVKGVTGYSWGCRCDRCRAGHKVYKRAWRERGGPAVERARAQSRAYKDAHRDQVRAANAEFWRRLDVRGTCKSCGGPMGIGYRSDGTCGKCLTAGKEANWRTVQLMWGNGCSMHEIAATLGWTTAHLGSEMSRIRRAGWKLPYRHRLRTAG